MISGRIIKMGLRIALWSLAAAAGLAGSFLALAALTDGENPFLSGICALIAWLFLLFFHLGKETLALPSLQPAVFLANAGRVLEKMGYEITRPSTTTLATRRAFQWLVFCRGIKIGWRDKQAHITGPKLWVDILRRRLRVENILVVPEPSVEDTQLRSTLLLKRVQIRMRIQPALLAEVTRHVLEVLTPAADVICEVNLLAQSESGIPERTIDRRIRSWLAEKNINHEIHKDLAKMPAGSSGSIVIQDQVRPTAPV